MGEVQVFPATEETTKVEEPSEERATRDVIRRPGTYVCTWNGQLLRVPQESTPGGFVMPAHTEGGRTQPIIQISDDPYVGITKARFLASNLSIVVDF